MIRKFFTILLVLFSCLTLQTTADSPLTFAGSGGWSGMVGFVAVGNYAYGSGSNGLMVLDISDMANPVIVNQILISKRIGSPLWFKDQLFLPIHEYGFDIYDLSDPTTPKKILSWTESPGTNFIKAHEDLLVLGKECSLELLDIANLSHPKSLSDKIEGLDDCYWPRDIAIKDEIMYVAAHPVRVIDISKPRSPVLISSLENNDWSVYPADLIVDDTLLFVGEGSSLTPAYASAIMIYNIAVPEHPVLITDWDYPNRHGDLQSITKQADNLYVCNGESGFTILDISDPYAPYVTGCYSVEGFVSSMMLVGETALLTTTQIYLNDGFYGYYNNCTGLVDEPNATDRTFSHYGAIISMDLTDKSSPTVIGSLARAGWIEEIVLSGNIAVTRASEYQSRNGISLFDISGDDNFPMIGQIRTPGVVTALAVTGDVVYVNDLAASSLNLSPGITAIDISDPTNPVFGSTLIMRGHYSDLEIYGDYLLAAGSFYSDLTVIDISDRLNPILVGSETTGILADHIAIAGSIAYCAGRQAGLQVVDMTDPTNPTILSVFKDSIAYHDISFVSISGHYLAATGAYSTYLFDISKPEMPILISEFMAATNYGMAMAGEYLLISNFSNPVEIWDLSNPAQPIEFAHYDTPGAVFEITTDQNHFYLADATSMIRLRLPIPTDVNDRTVEDDLPNSFSLLQNYPNPFNPSTTIQFSLDQPGQVRLDIYNVIGQLITRLVDESKPVGNHSIVWNGKNDQGQAVASGVYFYKLTANNVTESKKMLLLK